ncbi:PLP-dependent cysteine synthase family protein [Paenibacillus radicis (ex Gao et al. 2016)]|uniref:cysteine synthase n=1 Tax=Paenibacillus radicis (ex Gao et al. 2016) TaxID=1737354 RepID=A0A917HF27_9BACL|nr:cysteine synthase family protein [Paenibacillus radicis (ex Gao et al. 2016)]GGG77592.1 cysteine synthase [Paenibacillus radicis (ex Gao et al. 2016)]
MAYYRNVQQIVGNTPLLELTRYPLPNAVRLFAKLEFLNPGGSVKDRLGLQLLEHAFHSGSLRPGGTVIEPTAGNTGIGLALAAIGRDVSVIFVVPEKFSIEKQQLMKALGAVVVNTPTEQGILGAIRKAEALVAEIPGGYSPAQFSNPANPATYYETMAPEIWRDLNGELDIFVAGAGSGGTFMGSAAYFKEQNPHIRTVIVEPEGSILGGGKPGPHKTEGIGVEKLAPFMDTAYFDEVRTISDEDAFLRVKELALLEGLLVGSSSGAAMQAALLEAERAEPGSRIVTIFPDGSDRYLSKKIYEGGSE